MKKYEQSKIEVISQKIKFVSLILGIIFLVITVIVIQSFTIYYNKIYEEKIRVIKIISTWNNQCKVAGGNSFIDFDPKNKPTIYCTGGVSEFSKLEAFCKMNNGERTLNSIINKEISKLVPYVCEKEL